MYVVTGPMFRAENLKALLDRVVRALEAGKDLPDRVAPPVAAKEAENPFA